MNGLDKLQNTDFFADLNGLKDIKDYHIQTDEPPVQRLIRFMYENNPYVFLIGKTPVKLVFSKDKSAKSLQSALENIVNGKTC